MYVRRLLNFPNNEYIISFLLGFGLATIFRSSCYKEECLKFVGPTLEEIKNKQFKINNECYVFEPKYQKCNSNKNQIPFA